MPEVKPLIVVRVTRAYRVPPVYSGGWTDEDWKKVEIRTCEELVLRPGLLGTWVATGERGNTGEMLYRQVCSRSCNRYTSSSGRFSLM